MPSNFSTRTTNHSSTSSAPATPMAPTPSTHATDFKPAANQPAPRQPASNHTCTSHMDKWVINISKTPLTQEQLSLLQKGPNYAITPKYPPQKLTSLPQSKQPASYPPKKQMNLGQMSTGSSNKYNNNTTNTATSTPPMQGPYRTQTGPVQGGSYNGQRGGHGHH